MAVSLPKRVQSIKRPANHRHHAETVAVAVAENIVHDQDHTIKPIHSRIRSNSTPWYVFSDIPHGETVPLDANLRRKMHASQHVSRLVV